MSTPSQNTQETDDFSALRDVQHWVFDLDNTLYPAETDVFKQVSARITEFVATALGLEPDAAGHVRRAYYRTHGSTLRGMMENHATDPEHYLDFVHDIDVSVIAPSADLDQALTTLEGRKLIFTSANNAHAERILDRLGVRHHFEQLFSIESSNYMPKPKDSVYDLMIETCGVAPQRAAMFEDSARNLAPAADLGMVTVWLPNHTDFSQEGADGDHIDYIVEDLPSWLSAVGKARESAATGG